jgi:choline dehydrogenase-like flavoprotein
VSAAAAAPRRVQVLVVGSGAGGAVTALELARAGYEVLVLEEGGRHGLEDYGRSPTEAMKQLYRRRGMTPILGRTPIGYVEGCCLGGSTEINSGFWHRAPRDILLRWKAHYDLCDASEAELEPHYAWAEHMLGVARSQQPWPAGTQVFARGIEAMGWSYEEVARAAPGCRNTNTCAQGCPTGAKQGMSRSLLPQAEAAGARVVAGSRVLLLPRRHGRVEGAVASITGPDGVAQVVRIEADQVFVCAGPTETPALLQRSGIRYHVGNTLRIHPYLKVAARFREPIDAEASVLPLLQVKEFGPDLSLGGAYFTRGHLAMTLSENWPAARAEMAHHRHFAQYYVGVRGSGRGSVRPTMFGPDRTLIRYELSDIDLYNLSVGLARLSTLLLAGGAEAVHPSVHGVGAIRSEVDAIRWLDQRLARSSLGLVTVHAFSSCPMGERRDRCAADSYGRVYGYRNLRINDASMLPDSPGVNPQATVMAMARRNALQYAREGRGRA